MKDIYAKRIDWIDTSKGVGILAVVAGHIYSGEISRFIFSFHMPLFFFLGGYMHKVTQNKKQYLIKKLYSLILPYISFLIIIYFPNAVINYYMNKENLFEIIARPLIGGVFLVGWTGVFWFISCFFFTQQIINFLIVELNEKKTIALLVGFLMLSYINSYYLKTFWLPWSLNVVLAAAPIYYLGFIYKKSDFRLEENTYFILLLLLSIIITYFIKDNTLIMKSSYYGIPIVTLITSIIFVLFIKKISIFISKIHITKNIFSNLGKASMVIMYAHQPIQMILLEHTILTSPNIRFIISILTSYILYRLLLNSSITRGFFIGSVEDLKKIFFNYPSLIKTQTN